MGSWVVMGLVEDFCVCVRVWEALTAAGGCSGPAWAAGGLGCVGVWVRGGEGWHEAKQMCPA